MLTMEAISEKLSVVFRTPRKLPMAKSDSEEDSSDGDDSVHSSDIAFIEDDSELGLDDDDDSYQVYSTSASEDDSVDLVTESTDCESVVSESAGGASGENTTHEDQLVPALQTLKLSQEPQTGEKEELILSWIARADTDSAE